MPNLFDCHKTAFIASRPRPIAREKDSGGKKMMRMFFAIAALLGMTLASPAETLKVAVSQRGFWDSSFIEIGLHAGFFKEENLDIEQFYTDGGATTLDAVMSGSVDVAMSNGLLGVIGRYVKHAPIRVIASEFAGGSDAFWYARANSGIHSLKDAKDKTIAFSSNGSSTNLMVLALLKQAGVAAKPVATGGAPATYTQVTTGQIDIGWSVPPFGLQDIADGKLAIVAHGSDIEGLSGQTVRVNVVREDTLNTKRDALTRFTRAYNKAVDWSYSDPKALEFYATENKVPLALAQKMLEFYPRPALTVGKIQGLDLSLRDALGMKYIPAAMNPDDIKGLFDLVYPTP
jgi:NitT/TauT family transport system substrate-binding protein